MFDLHVGSVQSRTSLIREGAALRYMCGAPQRRPFCETTVTRPHSLTVHVIQARTLLWTRKDMWTWSECFRNSRHGNKSD